MWIICVSVHFLCRVQTQCEAARCISVITTDQLARFIAVTLQTWTDSRLTSCDGAHDIMLCSKANSRWGSCVHDVTRVMGFFSRRVLDLKRSHTSGADTSHAGFNSIEQKTTFVCSEFLQCVISGWSLYGSPEWTCCPKFCLCQWVD